MKEIVTKNAPAAIGPYAQGYIANGFVITSGQITGKLLKVFRHRLNGLVKMLWLF